MCYTMGIKDLTIFCFPQLPAQLYFLQAVFNWSSSLKGIFIGKLAVNSNQINCAYS